MPPESRHSEATVSYLASIGVVNSRLNSLQVVNLPSKFRRVVNGKGLKFIRVVNVFPYLDSVEVVNFLPKWLKFTRVVNPRHEKRLQIGVWSPLEPLEVVYLQLKL